MNLQAYDAAKEKYLTWINPRYKKLYSYEIKRLNFYTILKRYNRKLSKNDYYIALSNTIIHIDGKEWHSTNKYDGKVKIPLNEIWKDIYHKFNETTGVNISIVEEDNDGIIYELEI